MKTHPVVFGVEKPERARAYVVIYRLAAAALGHPVPELHEAMLEGRFHAAFSQAWEALTGRPWPCPSSSSPDFKTLEAGYIDAFLHGHRGRPRVALLSGDHEPLLEGLSRPVFMLNVQAFYDHFGLRAATLDEGRQEEPDHVVTMLEFMAVLHHLEAQALERGRGAHNFQRAQRDFLQRYLVPLIQRIQRCIQAERTLFLDTFLIRLIDDLAHHLYQQQVELEMRIGPGDADSTPSSKAKSIATQNLWG